jgi:hypothetical protein
MSRAFIAVVAAGSQVRRSYGVLLVVLAILSFVFVPRLMWSWLSYRDASPIYWVFAMGAIVAAAAACFAGLVSSGQMVQTIRFQNGDA